MGYVFAALILLVSHGAHAACELQTVTPKGRAGAVFKQQKTENGVSYYQAQVAGFTVTAALSEAALKSRAVDPVGAVFTEEVNGSGATLDDLNCFGGSTGDLQFKIKCSSPQLRERQKNGWPACDPLY
jgi:hypothetical protein